MISIEFSDFFHIFIVFAMVVLAICWGRLLWRSSSEAWNLSEDQLVRCRNCGVIYISPRIESAYRCPECQEINKIRNKKASRRMSY